MLTPRKSWILTLLLAVVLVGPMAAGAQGGAAQADERLRVLERLQVAHSLFAQRDYEAARKFYLEVLPHFPDNFDILKNLAFCNFRLRNYSEAAKYYQRAYEINPGAREIPDYLARSLMALKQYDQAATLLRRLAEMPGGAPVLWKRAAEAYEAGGRTKDAELAYDAYLQRNPGDLQARTDLGKVYAKAKDYPKAQAQFRLVLSSNPNFSPALIGMARVLAWQGQHEESLKLYGRVLLLDPRDGEALTGRAFVLLWMGRYQEAYTLFTELRRRYPGDSEVAQALEEARAKLEQQGFETARRTGDAARLEQFYRERIARDPNDVAALKALAGLTASVERCQESIDFGQRAVALSPGEARLELNLARVLAYCERFDEAFAHFQRYRETQPEAEGTLTELGWLLLRARRPPEAAQVFRNALQVNPDNRDAAVGLARSLASTGNYQEALARYEMVLEGSPYHYDALQGKAFVLYWTKDFAGARELFQRLTEMKPEDTQNAEALKNIARAEEDARWAALRPGSEAPPEEFVTYFEKRLAAFPDDQAAVKGLAYNQGRLRNFNEAVAGYRKYLTANPDDASAKKELARLLSMDRQYDESIQLYRELAAAAPEDTDIQENLARVYVWSNSYQDALPVYRALADQHPDRLDYRMDLARMQLRLGDYAGARASLNTVLAADPQNGDARLTLAQLDLREGNREASLRRYDEILAQDPNNTDALFGKARILYYEGELGEAHRAANQLVDQKPDSFDAIFLLATIENARGRRRPALDLLDRAGQISPGNPQVVELTQHIREQPVLTLRTSSTYGREISEDEDLSALGEVGDLRFQSHRATFGWKMFPSTDSFLTLGYYPVSSPSGFLRGQKEPSDFLYSQRTRVTRRLTLRTGIGAVHFGGGEDRRLPGLGTHPTAENNVLGLASFSYKANDHVGFDLAFRRSAITYTPTSTGLGVMENEYGSGVDFTFDPKTTLRLAYSYASYSALGPGADHGHFGRIRLERNLYGSDRIVIDTGYEGEFRDFAGRKRDVFLGFFNPDFYQVHQLIGRFWANVANPLDFEIRGGYGVRQQDHIEPLSPGSSEAIRGGGSVSPALIIRVHRRLTVILRYSYYNTAQTLGDLRGNVFTIVTEWKF